MPLCDEGFSAAGVGCCWVVGRMQNVKNQLNKVVVPADDTFGFWFHQLRLPTVQGIVALKRVGR